MQGGFEWDHAAESFTDMSTGSAVVSQSTSGSDHADAAVAKEGLTYFHAPHDTQLRCGARLTVKCRAGAPPDSSVMVLPDVDWAAAVGVYPAEHHVLVAAAAVHRSRVPDRAPHVVGWSGESLEMLHRSPLPAHAAATGLTSYASLDAQSTASDAMLMRGPSAADLHSSLIESEAGLGRGPSAADLHALLSDDSLGEPDAFGSLQSQAQVIVIHGVHITHKKSG